jgi:hypothetical protein
LTRPDSGEPTVFASEIVMGVGVYPSPRSPKRGDDYGMILDPTPGSSTQRSRSTLFSGGRSCERAARNRPQLESPRTCRDSSVPAWRPRDAKRPPAKSQGPRREPHRKCLFYPATASAKRSRSTSTRNAHLTTPDAPRTGP